MVFATAGEDFEEYRTWMESHSLTPSISKSSMENLLLLSLSILILKITRSPVFIPVQWQIQLIIPLPQSNQVKRIMW